MSVAIEERIEALLRQMTLEEKASLAAGADLWHTVGIERLGIPGLKVTDGPNGARGSQWQGKMTSACFPAPVCLSATWNVELVEKIGQALGQETQSKGAHVLLAPTVNIHRVPVGGRNFECFSEDPYLTARMAVAYIRGVQSQGVGACIKHFVCNDQEFQRNSISVEVRERALREIYLPPFEAAVREAHVYCVMGAYNRLNGTFCCEHPYILTEVLKGEWRFDGVVISDWTATQSTVPAANAGLDLEMPGPARYFGDRLIEAVRAGQVSEATIEDKARRLLRLMIRTGALDQPRRPEQAVDRPEHRQLIRQAAAEGMVLLKNEREILPLDRARLRRVAVIGPNAKTARIMGGGSAHVNPHYVISPLDGVREKCGDAIEVLYALGCTNHKALPLLDPEWLTPAEGEPGPGLQCEYFNTLEPAGQPVRVEVVKRPRFMWIGEVAPEVEPSRFSIRLSGKLVPPESGTYTFSLISAGLSRLSIDGKEIVDNWTAQTPGEAFFGAGSAEVTGTMDLEAGRTYTLEVLYSSQGAAFLKGLIVGGLPPMPADPIAEAVEVARGADVALVFVGTTEEWESEGFDRQDIELPGRQNELVERVAAANPNTVVILNNGGPLTMPWLERVPAVLEAWFPGQECGHAIADVLFGDVTPSGKLPTTFPRRLEDTPSFLHHPGEGGKIYYGEGIFVGYRYYDKKKVEPLFPFGFGLSYTTFAYEGLTLSAAEIGPDEELEAQVTLTNTGPRAGQEVVQLYVRDVASRVNRPERELKGFAKVALQPGESQAVRFRLSPRALAYFDEQGKRWVAEAGEYAIEVGSSSRDIRAAERFVLRETWMAPLRSEQPSRGPLSLRSPLRELLADPRGEAVLREHLGELLDLPQVKMAMDFSLEQMAPFAPQVLTKEKLAAIETALRSLG